MKKIISCVLDVEATGLGKGTKVYDIGFKFIDNYGNVYARISLVVAEIFFNNALMSSAYYAEKMPMYYVGIENGDFVVMTFAEIKKLVADMFAKYNCHRVLAYNANYDKNALAHTVEYLLNETEFFPQGTEVQCIWHMACQTICMQKAYAKFCIANGFVSASGNIKTNAETVYAYLTKTPDFEEKHTGAEDVDIETAIYLKCLATHKKMDRAINCQCWKIPQAQAREILALV